MKCHLRGVLPPAQESAATAGSAATSTGECCHRRECCHQHRRVLPRAQGPMVPHSSKHLLLDDDELRGGGDEARRHAGNSSCLKTCKPSQLRASWAGAQQLRTSRVCVHVCVCVLALSFL